MLLLQMVAAGRLLLMKIFLSFEIDPNGDTKRKACSPPSASSVRMSRTANPFWYFHSSPWIIRLAVFL